MDETTLHSLGVSLAFAASAVLVWWAALRFLDWLAGGWGHFKHNVADLIHSSPDAAARYYGYRLLAAAIVVGLVLSAVRF